MAKDIIQIENAIPPLRQSTQEIMACPTFYVTSMIEGNQMPGGLDSARGTEIHKTMATYLRHCAAERVETDLEAFDRFSRGAGPLAAKILSGLRDGFVVDWQHLFDTELTLSLDENLNPTHIPEVMGSGVTDSGLPEHFQGTLDGLYLFPDRAAVRVDDFKSHARPFDPDDKPQGEEYSLLALKHFPWAMSVTFRLVFVRYKKVVREVTYTRDDLPMLAETLRFARERQKKIHEDYRAGRDIAVLAGSHCLYCSLLSNAGCPIAQYNPAAQYTPQERLNFNLWYAQFSRANNAALKSYVQETGKPVVLKDYNGKAYVYGPVEKETEVYPLFKFNADGMEFVTAASPVMPIIDRLIDYACDNPDDSTWMRNVVISSTSLRRYLKTNKRAFLDQSIEDNADKVTKVSLRVSKPLDAVPEEEDWEEDDWEEEVL